MSRALLAVLLISNSIFASAIIVEVSDKQGRTQLGTLGFAIEGITKDTVTIFGDEKDLAEIERAGFKASILEMDGSRDFPTSDSPYHNYAEMKAELEALVGKNPAIASMLSIGKSIEGRDLLGIRISKAVNLDTLPTAIYMGCHHAREHLSVEVPLKLAQYLVNNYATDTRVQKIVDTTEIYILPMINPDGAEHDIASGSYKMWRKNRRSNADGSKGVDLNRNYGGGPGFWGGAGSSSNPSSDTYHGTSEFSEPETQAVRDFVRARKRTTTLLSFHTFSELVLWPYGGKDDQIASSTDLAVFETMGKKMASLNHYSPQKSSDLYVATGDTCDWAYEELKIFAFTFELSPSSLFGGGFYPGQKAIEPTFKANLEPMLYLLEKTQNPYSVLRESTDPLGIL